LTDRSDVDLKGANARGIVDSHVLVALHGLAVFAFEFQKLDVDLNLMPRHLERHKSCYASRQQDLIARHRDPKRCGGASPHRARQSYLCEINNY
jgi:hypothetical protein